MFNIVDCGFVDDRAVIVAQENVRISAIRHRPVEIIVAESVHLNQLRFGIFRRF